MLSWFWNFLVSPLLGLVRFLKFFSRWQAWAGMTLILSIMRLVDFIADCMNDFVVFLNNTPTVAEFFISGGGEVYLDSGTANAILFVNAIFPLEEAFAYMSVLFGFYLMCLTYRLIKSFIPTLS